MTYPSYETLRPSYARLWAELRPTPERVPALNMIGTRLMRDKPTYQRVSDATGVPWFVVGLIDMMEGGGGCRTHLHNGDPLNARTVKVPAGRPPGDPSTSSGAFTFEQSAVDALVFDDLDKVKEWPIERIAYQLEKYNGGGYLDKPIVSPYLASWSNKYTAGKYVADHVYDPAAVSAQPGALTILKILATLDPDVASAIAGVAPELPELLSKGSKGPDPAKSPAQPATQASTTAQPQPSQPKETTMTTTTAPAEAPPKAAAPALPAIPSFNLNTVEVDLEMIAPVITMIAGFIPGGAIVVPFIPVVETGLKMAAAVQAAPDGAGKLGVIEAHLHDIANLIGQAKAAFAPAKATAA